MPRDEWPDRIDRLILLAAAAVVLLTCFYSLSQR